MKIEEQMIDDNGASFVFFESVKEAEPESVLDAGVFLPRIAAISRRMFDLRIPEETRLDTINRFEYMPEIYTRVYDHIYLPEEATGEYDMAFLLCHRGFLSEKEYQELSVRLLKNSRIFITDKDAAAFFHDYRAVVLNENYLAIFS